MELEARLTESAADIAPRTRRSKQTQSAARARKAARTSGHDEDQREAMADREELDEGDDAFYEAFLDSVDESALPDLPKIPGYHVCWVSTLNAHDRPEKRQRMGYKFILVSDVPGWKDVEGPKAGEYAGVIRVNEMVAMKLPLRLYQKYMEHWHHAEPLADEEKLRARNEDAKERAEMAGAAIVEEGDGTAEIVQRGLGRPEFLS